MCKREARGEFQYLTYIRKELLEYQFERKFSKENKISPSHSNVGGGAL